MASPFPASNFCETYKKLSPDKNGVMMLIKFIEMCNEPNIPNKDIAKEFNMTESNVTYWQKKLGNFTFKVSDEILEFIENKMESAQVREEKLRQFVQGQKAIIIRHDFRKASNQRGKP